MSRSSRGSLGSRGPQDSPPDEMPAPVRLRHPKPSSPPSRAAVNTTNINSNGGNSNRPTSYYDNLSADIIQDYFQSSVTISNHSSSQHSLGSSSNRDRNSYTDTPRVRNGMIIDDGYGPVTLRRPSADHRRRPSAGPNELDGPPPPLPPKKRNNLTAYMHNISSFYQPSEAVLKMYTGRAQAYTGYYAERHTVINQQVELSFAERQHQFSAASSGSDESMWSLASSVGNNSTGGNAGSSSCHHRFAADLNNVKLEVPPLLPPALPPKSKQSKQPVQSNHHQPQRSTSPPPLRGDAVALSDKDSGISSHSASSSSPTPSKPPIYSSVVKPQKRPKSPIDAVDVSPWLLFKSDGGEGPDILGGTADALLVKATEKEADILFVEAFLTTYRTFISPKELINKLIYRYNKFLNVSEIRQKVAINAFALLVRTVDDLCVGDCSDDLLEKLTDFVNSMVNKGDVKLARFLENKTREKKENRKSLLAEKSPILLPSVAISTKVNQLTDFKSKLVAEQMTLLDQQLFAKIEMPEVLMYAENQDREDLYPNLTKFTEHFNKMSFWTRSRILQEEEARDREKLVQKLLKIVKHLRKLNNFNSYLAIVSALDSAPVRRLEWPKHVVEEIKDYSALIDSSSSFKAYRVVLANTEPPCIPYIGLLLQDLFFINQGNSDQLPDGKINFDKRWKLFERIDELRRFKVSQYPFKKNDQIVNYFNDFDDYLHEESMWQISESIRPRKK